MRFGRRSIGFLVAVSAPLASLAACSDGSPLTVPAGRVAQFTTEVAIGAGRRVVVLAVDDGPSDESVALRNETEALMRTTLEERFAAGSAHLGSDWQRADLRVVLVHPSATGSARAIGPSDDPALAVVGDNVSLDAIDRLADATASDINAWAAPANAPYALLDATARTLQLVTGRRSPDDAREANLVASLGSPEAIAFVVASARDDEGTESVDADLAPLTGVHFELSAIFSRLTGTAAPCSWDLALPARLAAWDKALGNAQVYSSTYDMGCLRDVSDLDQSGLLGAINSGYGKECFPSAIAHLADGSGVCTVTATMFDASPCSAHPGMLDPRDPDGVRRPRMATGTPAASRVCEIQPLTGDQATACRESAACTGCGPGWCDSTASPGCPAGGWLRIAHGATPPGSARIDLTCDLASR
jgi:hypothetical protein